MRTLARYDPAGAEVFAEVAVPGVVRAVVAAPAAGVTAPRPRLAGATSFAVFVAPGLLFLCTDVLRRADIFEAFALAMLPPQ
jgi:hypothetical protein